MTVFNTFINIVKSYKTTIILYTVLLIGFAGFNLQTSDTNTNFVNKKPDILIINKDEEVGVTKNLIDYLHKNSNDVNIKNDENSINDALFYRDINYIVYIPENYRSDFLKGLNPTIEVKTTGTYQSSLAEMLLSRYVKIANTYEQSISNEDELITKINDTLKENTDIEITSKLDTNSLERVAFYYNFLNYSLLAACVYVICLVLSSFRQEKIKKRTIISSMNYKKLNRQLLLCNGLLAIALWFVYVLLSYILLGNIVLSQHGLIFILNSFIFMICALSLSFLIGNLVSDKNAINGIVNVVALGSSFLAGAFVPTSLLPDSVLKLAHVLPSYWYINSNEMIKTLEVINFNSLKPVLINMGVILLFSSLYIILANIIYKYKRKIA